MKISVCGSELATLLDRMPEQTRILSLDCFDTLLWRNTHQPGDVFADIPFAGGAREPRTTAEALARRTKGFVTGKAEVSIEQIYQKLLPGASPETVAAAVQHELDAEARHCFGFEPAVALIRAAKARGLDVIIISDTYLSAEQLRTLIARAAGQEVADAIDRIFASSEYGMSKGAGLFKPVLKALGVAPDTILHVGDNHGADQRAPSQLGVSTVHLRQFDSAVQHRLRLEASMATMLDHRVRTDVPALQPHRVALALRTAGTQEWTTGHDVIGPIMHGFLEWIRAEAARMEEAAGKPVKILFLMRDGYLPMRVLQAMGGEGVAVEVSRLTSTRSSFFDHEAVDRYIIRALHRREDTVGRALLLTDAEVAKLKGKGDHLDFKRAVLAPPIRARIVTRSKAYADRLEAHFRSRGVEDGDAVMLVDLGYNGSVQNMIQPVLEARMGLTVAGRYLLLREQETTGHDKRGYFDTRHYDYRALHALSLAIAVVEQLATVAQGSVIDYTPAGDPIRDVFSIKDSQAATRDAVQAGCIDYVKTARAGMYRPPASDDEDGRRQMAVAILARLLFLPSNEEVELFRTFDQDVNLGVKDMIKMVDTELSADGLRRRGMQYLKDANRMYLSAELQPQGIPLNMAFFNISRFGLDLRGSDFQTGEIQIPTILTDGATDAVTGFGAHPTHDGYYMMSVPIGAARFSAAIQFGTLFEMVQIDEVSVFDLQSFGAKGARPTSRIPVYDAMTPVSDKVFRCDETGLMFVEPPKGQHLRPQLLVVVFRPIVHRSGVALQKAA
ncbi:MAG TPA: HAD family hydrolase [Sphingomonas sp.]